MNEAQLRVLMARYQSILDFMDRLVVTRELDDIAALFSARARHIADIARCELIARWMDTEVDEWFDGHEVFALSGSAANSGRPRRLFGELDPTTQAVLRARSVLTWSGMTGDEILRPLAEMPEAPNVQALPIEREGVLRGVLITVSRSPLSATDRRLMRSMSLLTGTLVAAMLSEHELLSRIERRSAEMRALVDELSAVISPVWDGVLMMPLVGKIDRGRAELILERLLAAAHTHTARHVILDVTGISSIDSESIGHIDRILRALGMLGTRGTIVGLQPAVAQHLIESGYSGHGTTFRRNLREALIDCIRVDEKTGS